MKKTQKNILLAAAAFIGGLAGVCGTQLPTEENEIPTVGISFVSSPNEGTPAAYNSGGGVEQELRLIDALEQDQQVTVVSPVQAGKVLCDSLGRAEDASVLRFGIDSNEVIVAERSSHSKINGDAFSDGVDRKVWVGTVVDPAEADGGVGSRTVSLTWGEPCDVETFLLKVTTRRKDGSTSVVKSIPCEGGASADICVVKLRLEFDPVSKGIEEGIDTYGANSNSEPSSRRLHEETHEASGLGAIPGRRKLQTSTQISVMFLYSDLGLERLGNVTPAQMESTLTQAIVWTNEAMVNSKIPLEFVLVYAGPLPYTEEDLDSLRALRRIRGSTDVADLRDTYGADLVQFIGSFDDVCGRAFVYNGAHSIPDSLGYSVVGGNCLDNFVHTHEFGHNLGCRHDRESTSFDTDYAHGLRYCDGGGPYRTIMSYDCGTPQENYFSNPDVYIRGTPTGTATEDNARKIRETMVAISNYRSSPATPTPHQFSFVGCFVDGTKDRVLSGEFVKHDDAMTTEACATQCEGSTFFGTEYGLECFCGTLSDEPDRLGESTSCDYPCAGDDAQACGGHSVISVYKYTGVSYMGCYADEKGARAMDKSFMSSSMTTELCMAACGGSQFFGTQYGIECWCGNGSTDYDTYGDSHKCTYECAGDAGQQCGGYDAMSVYAY